MYLSVTVTLDKKQYKDKGLSGLWRAIKLISKDVDLEAPHFDERGRWSYTFKIEVENIKTLRITLRENGNYKIVKIVDINHNQTLLPKKKK